MRTALSKFASTGSASTSQEVAPLLTLGDAQTSIFRPPLGTAAPTSSPPKRIWFAAALAGFMLVSSVLLAALYANRPTTTEVAVVPGAWTTPEPTNAATGRDDTDTRPNSRPARYPAADGSSGARYHATRPANEAGSRSYAQEGAHSHMVRR